MAISTQFMEHMFILLFLTSSLKRDKQTSAMETYTFLGANLSNAKPLVHTVAQYASHLLLPLKCCSKALSLLNARQIKAQALFTFQTTETALFQKYAALAVSRQEVLINLILSYAQEIFHIRTILMIPP